MLNQIVLLFALNLLDAVLTILWVRNGIATESNQLMAELLNVGNIPFLTVKISIGAITAFVLFRFSHKWLARLGLTISLGVYLGLMLVHTFTGLSAFGYLSENFVQQVGTLSTRVFALLI
jgi:Domain of unknown function (DUF5658)